MIWLILALVATFLTVFFAKRDNEAVYFAFIFSVIFWVASFAVVATGIRAYPELVGMRQKAITLQEHVELVREARYSVKPGSLVGGALDNMEQSKTLSEYITECANAKAEANALLAEFQVKRQNTWYLLFGPSIFYSSKITELKPLPPRKGK